MPVLASSRAGNLARALVLIALLTLMFREVYLLWFFHTAAWTSRPAEMKWCGSWYERVDSRTEKSRAEAETLAGGHIKKVWQSPTLKPVLAYKVGSHCPNYAFVKVSRDGYVAYALTN